MWYCNKYCVDCVTQMNNTQIAILSVGISIFLVGVYMYTKKDSTSVEGYRDPIWMNKKKMYNDWYPRSNGSIYGNYYQPWDMFSGFPVFPRAY